MKLITINEHAHGDDHHWPAPTKRDDWFYHSFDARVWAKAFCEDNPEMDEETMIAWFANALMRGYDEGRYKAPPHE